METKFVPPFMPGWQVFQEALGAMLSKPSLSANRQVSASLEARKNELIPDGCRDGICYLVLQVGVKSADVDNDYKLPTAVVEFLHCQIGRDALAIMLSNDELTAGKWDVGEKDDDPRGIGYDIFTTDRARFRRGVLNESCRNVSRSLFGDIGLVEVNMKELFDRLRSPEHASEEPAAPAAETAEPE